MENIIHCISVAHFYRFLYVGVINMDFINNMGSCEREGTLINLMLINRNGQSTNTSTFKGHEKLILPH